MGKKSMCNMEKDCGTGRTCRFRPAPGKNMLWGETWRGGSAFIKTAGQNGSGTA